MPEVKSYVKIFLAASPPRRKGKRKKRKGKLFPRTPKPAVAVTARRIVPVTVRRADDPRNTVPGSAAQRSFLATHWTRRVSSAWQGLSVPIGGPFPYVSEHVVQAIRI